ncbi:MULTISPECIES: papain-like cysteine protease family protein [Sphingosinicellaceae]|uniref:papain-like cysteine protease family protein n=1 Tax=Sphingosinicellaceae TaxID=2820280 RepID=UPI001C1E293A|nr:MULTISPECIES: papain-like cysteine protease family protein [Polymorphobacter]QYE35643.1 hypothetical protein KZX46_06620 [Polymorphobacter sp. PAMC 29334]UAJ10992.1 hypothetical protein KTC28_04555 [Polymorphobacter megasporae]
MPRTDPAFWLDVTPTGTPVGEHMVSNTALVAQAPYLDLCWAACATMVLRHLGQQVDLPTVVKATYGNFVDQTAWPQHIYIDVYGLNCLYLLREQLLGEGPTGGSVWVGDWLRADWPLQPYIRWNGSSDTHTIVLGGVYGDGRVRVLDPAASEESTHTFDDVMQGFGEGTLEGIWYDIGYRPRGLAMVNVDSDG